ncbi:uncharacterized protein SCHCODRAFT_01300477 [Schizophyllum commune H4-8]|uniref:uncharacterized protein n=1 Tax=Schizophyllum commune (strain H4-8 / FGSC 9210) TaxID=578458 RepID=UPI00216023D4|nr:uncharacterized protein SCHCODRAFT_01300477 [Schizophyllum commune H4-8]KAI5892270.1 hypothetical protein SCHCODRAFT_01300477 [Schizophyllum commune H4-8]
MTLGTVLATKVKTEQGGYASHSAQELLKGSGMLSVGRAVFRLRLAACPSASTSGCWIA